MSLRQILVFCAVLGTAVSANATSHHQATTHKSKTVVSQSKASEPLEQLVDINVATVAQLQTVKGIGPKKAAAVVAYRDANGPFKRVEDITKVKGIGNKKLVKIQPYLTI